MSRNILRSLAISAVGMLCTSFCLAQTGSVMPTTGDKFLISAKAGGVNATEGSVGIIRKTGTSGHLFKGETLEIGDRVSTGSDGKAEILLNPGSYARLGYNSAFEFNTTSLDDLQLRIDSGSAIFEVFALEEFKVTVLTPNAKFILIESGVFRVDVLTDGTGRISVRNGKAQLGDANATIVKKGRAATLNGNVSKVSKFDWDDKDDLIAWSKLRAKQLAETTAALKNNRNLRTSLMGSFLGGRWSMYNSFGLWVYDPRTGRSCFLPFGGNWHSPYGYGFGNCSCYYDLPRVVYYPPPYVPTGGGSTGPTITQIVTAGDRSPVPPFIRMQGTSGLGDSGGGITRRIQDSGSPGRDSGPVYSPPPSSPPPAPPPTRTGTRDGGR